MAIRLSIGASRGRIVRQLLAESLLLALCGTGAGLGLDLALTSFISHLQLPLPLPVQLRIQPDWRLVAYSVMVTLGCTFAAGLMPAITGTRAGVGAAPKQDDRQVGRSGWTLRYVLVVGQLSVSIVLLCAGFVFMRNLFKASTMNPGFDIEHTVWASMRLVPEAYPQRQKTRALVDEALAQLRTLPGIQAASSVREVPLNGHSTTGSKLRTDLGSPPVLVTFNDNYVSADYFEAMRIPILQGRGFLRLDRIGSPRVAILNENLAAKLFGRMNPVGHTIQFGDGAPITIVGIAKNTKHFTIGEQDARAYYEPYGQWNDVDVNLQFLIRASGRPEPLIPAINRTLSQLDPTAALEINR